ncbi:MAG: ABC transporter substrate-binding protein [Proteobacteria bacterium]|nr:ABC transporter substrate-binding protein [Pseudomonadota bacterium]MDA1356561.1 ABC transporter substrate-binding protein [Pseudomonadota bacterium]
MRLPGTALLASVLAVVLLAAVMGGAERADAQTYIETPSLEARVAAGELAPIAERLPTEPRVVAMDGKKRVAGRHGGRWRMLIHRSNDVKMFSVYGYTRLVTYNEALDLVPDILADVIAENERVFTLKLRDGHKWSDGHPFTSEDFRYYWEDVANNEELSPSGPPRALRVNSELPVVEIIDETTVRYSWSQPNPTFLPSLAGAAPLFIYRPAHYLEQFHGRYKEKKKKLGALTNRLLRSWAAEHNNKDNLYKFDNPDLPTLQPWTNTTRPPATRFVGLRNPYFHRVDPNGRQLPYFDEVTMTVADSKLIPAKVGSGEVDLQARNLNFSDYTFLKEGEERHNYTVRLWRTAGGARLALYPNLNIKDERWRALFRDVRFRRGLSMAINRHEINQVMYYGLGIEGNNTVLPGSPLFEPRYRDEWANYDVVAANHLLDETGLTDVDDDGFRLFADGDRLEIIVETAGEDTEQSDVLELVRDAWAEIGIKVYTKPSQREVFRNRIYAGESQMSIWTGYENAMPTADMSPEEFSPTRQTSLQWSQWGQHYETSGMSGVAPELPAAARLLELHEEWFRVGKGPERQRIWHDILDIHADNVFTIGLISGVLQPVAVANNLRNVPEVGIYNWNPGSHLGIYMPDTFWFDE